MPAAYSHTNKASIRSRLTFFLSTFASQVAKLVASSCTATLTAFISPYLADRALARKIHEESKIPFLEVFVDAPLEEVEKRDPKGLYAKARAGVIKGEFRPCSRPLLQVLLPGARTRLDPVSFIFGH